MMKIVLFVAAMLFCTANSFAGYLVTNATIKSVGNTDSNYEQFWVTTIGGEGPCANTGMVFPLSAAGSAKVYDRAYSTALTALSTGMNVDIYNYQNSDCRGAAFIEVKK